MVNLLSIFALCFWVTAAFSQSSPSSPCMNILQYKSYHERFSGWIVTPPTSKSNLILTVEMIAPFEFQVSHIGTIHFPESEDSVRQRIRMQQPIMYVLNFPLNTPLPFIAKIIFNDQIICSANPPISDITTYINLTHTFYSEKMNTLPMIQNPIISSRIDDKPQENTYPSNNQVKTTVEELKKPTITSSSLSDKIKTLPMILNPITASRIDDKPQKNTSPSINQVKSTVEKNTLAITSPPETKKSKGKTTSANRNSKECGVVESKAFSGNQFGGIPANRGDYPWLVAIMNASGHSNLLCAGTLISKKHVLTSYNCLYAANKDFEVLCEEILVLVGAYDLTRNAKKPADPVTVEEIKFIGNTEKEDGLAILVLNEDITINDNVNRACLWSDEKDTSNFNKIGTTLGWGLTEKGILSLSVPNVVEIPITDFETCRNSEPALQTYVSDRTICGGDRDKKGACTGDAGGGLFVKNGAKWYIRGVISSSFLNKKGECDTSRYTLFTDTIKLYSWIKSVVGSAVD